MKKEQIEKLDDMYIEYERITTINLIKYTALFAIPSIILIANYHNVAAYNHIYLTIIKILAITTTLVVAPSIMATGDFNKNIRKFKEEYKEYDFPKNIFKIEKQRQKEVNNLKKEYRTEYITKCEEIKKEVTNPVHVDLSYYETQPEKVKVKVKKR